YRLDWPAARQHLRGPFPIEGSTDRRWVLNLGGEARQDVQLVVRGPFQDRLQPWTEARLDADFIVRASQMQAPYEIDLQRWHDRLRSVTLDLPAGVRINTLVLRQPGNDVPLAWQMTSPQVMSITLPETVEQRATLLLEAQWPLKTGERVQFPAPGVRGS